MKIGQDGSGKVVVIGVVLKRNGHQCATSDVCTGTFDPQMFTAQPESFRRDQREWRFGRVEVNVDVGQVDPAAHAHGSQRFPVEWINNDHVIQTDLTSLNVL